MPLTVVQVVDCLAGLTVSQGFTQWAVGPAKELSLFIHMPEDVVMAEAAYHLLCLKSCQGSRCMIPIRDAAFLINEVDSLMQIVKDFLVSGRIHQESCLGFVSFQHPVCVRSFRVNCTTGLAMLKVKNPLAIDKSLIGFLSAHALIPVRQPANVRLWKGVERGDVGFEIQERGVIQYIHIQDLELMTFDGEQPYNGEADWVGAAGRAGGKQAAFVLVQEGHNAQLESLAAMEMVEQNDV
jgi:hypothetical protein